MRVAIVYNEPVSIRSTTHWLSQSAPGHASSYSGRDASEYGVLDQVRGVEHALREGGYDVQLHAVVSATALAAFLDREHPTVVFNCCETYRGVAALEMSVAALYDLWGVAYTGSPALTLGIALNKGLAKSLFRANGISTPRSVVMESPADLARPHDLAYPLIVKPIAEDASIGIDAGAVVGDAVSAARRVELIWSAFGQPAIIEEFIDGWDLNVGLLADSTGELQTLPVSEIRFDTLPPGTPAIVSYDAKWVADSEVYKATMSRCPAVLEPVLAERVRQTALSAARTVGLRDYGRIDMRVRANDQALFVLEANPNPDLCDDGGFMRAAVVSGRSVADTVRQILSRAVDRAQTTNVP